LLALGLLGWVDLLLVHQQHVLRHHASDGRVGAAQHAAFTTTSPPMVRIGQR
jgi:hypothetical protein